MISKTVVSISVEREDEGLVFSAVSVVDLRERFLSSIPHNSIGVCFNRINGDVLDKPMSTVLDCGRYCEAARQF